MPQGINIYECAANERWSAWEGATPRIRCSDALCEDLCEQKKTAEPSGEAVVYPTED